MKQSIQYGITQLFGIMLLCTQAVWAQGLIIGIVSDENGSPLPGATVVVEETNTGTTTDFDGNYQIAADIGQTLVFSYVGYESQSVSIADITIDVQLQPANELEGVVVTALGIEREAKALGYAVSKIEGEDLFVLRYNLKLTDGRSFSTSSTGENVRSTSHDSPFRYSAVVGCFKVPEPGDRTLEMKDTAGDGWDGGSIVVSIDGNEKKYTCKDGATNETITVPDGVSRFLVTYNSGKLEGENTYTLKDPSGNIVIEDGSGDGGEDNGPESGEQFNKCE